jgi:hypothetical protein
VGLPRRAEPADGRPTSGVTVMWLRAVAAVATSLLLLSASACGSQSSPKATPGTESSAIQINAKDFDRENFDRPTVIDNEWYPLRPGTQLVTEGSTLEGGRRVPHRLVFTVTDLTKVIAGVRTRVIWDRDYSQGRLVETELAFFAQDNGGNVWELGEHPEAYEDGKLVESPTWIHRVKGSRAGLSMKAQPRPEESSYSLGWGPAVGFNDRAKVRKVGQRTCVPLRCYENVLLVAEFNPDEPGRYQLKYYAPGVGNVRVGWEGVKDTSKETLALVKAVHLSPAAIAKVREEALKLEKSAYRISKDVYGRTSPAKPGA